jgi:phage-related tail fiber protein
MTTTTTTRLSGVAGNLSMKAPCRVATTTNITLSGLQAIDGVTVAAGDRVLVKDQTTGAENGIYDASSGDWTRSKDFNGNRDVTTGTRVFVFSGNTYAVSEWYVSTTGTITIGETAITWTATSPLSALTTFSPGTEGAPGLAVTTDTDSGLYRIGADNLGISLGGSKVLDIRTA